MYAVTQECEAYTLQMCTRLRASQSRSRCKIQHKQVSLPASSQLAKLGEGKVELVLADIWRQRPHKDSLAAVPCSLLLILTIFGRAWLLNCICLQFLDSSLLSFSLTVYCGICPADRLLFGSFWLLRFTRWLDLNSKCCLHVAR